MSTRQRLSHEQVVGTPGGYGWHLRDGSEPCQACTEAHAVSMAMWKDQRNPNRSVRVPLAVLGRLLAAVPHADRAAVTEALGHLANRALTIYQLRRASTDEQ